MTGRGERPTYYPYLEHYQPSYPARPKPHRTPTRNKRPEPKVNNKYHTHSDQSGENGFYFSCFCCFLNMELYFLGRAKFVCVTATENFAKELITKVSGQSLSRQLSRDRNHLNPSLEILYVIFCIYLTFLNFLFNNYLIMNFINLHLENSAWDSIYYTITNFTLTTFKYSCS